MLNRRSSNSCKANKANPPQDHKLQVYINDGIQGMIRVWNSGTSDVAARKLRLGWLQSFVGEKLSDHAGFCSVGVVSFLAGKVCVLVPLRLHVGTIYGV